MSYTEELGVGAVVASSANWHTAENLAAAAAAYGEKLVFKALKIRRIGFVVTTTVAADATAPVVEFNKRPTPGSATGETLVGQLTIPDGTAAGKVIYKDIQPVAFAPGDSIAAEHVTQAVDGSSAAGAGFYVFDAYLDQEYVLNESDMVASA